ncbi:hypothetical protein [Streptomyces longisporus]|uniref:hypothetical protein n=1 Tax=Streptomyces longisporus TaxID=1948 RepID=UPI0031CF43C9
MASEGGAAPRAEVRIDHGTGSPGTGVRGLRAGRAHRAAGGDKGPDGAGAAAAGPADGELVLTAYDYQCAFCGY